MGGQLGARQRRLVLASVSGRRTDDAGCCRGLAQLEGPGRGPRGRQLCCEGGCWPTPGLPGEARGNAVRAARLGRRAGPQSSPSSSTGAAAPRARPRCPAGARTAGQRGTWGAAVWPRGGGLEEDWHVADERRRRVHVCQPRARRRGAGSPAASRAARASSRASLCAGGPAACGVIWQLGVSSGPWRCAAPPGPRSTSADCTSGQVQQCLGGPSQRCSISRGG